MDDPQPSSGSELERDKLGSIALDQWRGLALIMVLISHGFYYTNRVHGIGRVGVNLFFFVSGILVYRTLSRSRATNDWERSRSFWWRRFRRLYPALLAYTLVMLVASWWLQRLPNLPVGSDFHSYVTSLGVALGYGINYLPEAPMSLGHLWSLACEMQFYLLAPLIFIIGGRTVSRRTLIFGLLLLTLLTLGLIQPLLGKWKYHFEFAVWPMMAGFFCEYRRDWFSHLSEWVVKTVLWLSLAASGVSFGLMLFGQEMKILVIGTGALLLAPCLLAYLYGRPLSGFAGRCLRWFGERTYSIYLWQQPFTICQFLPAQLHPLGALAAIGIGALSFRVCEFPFLSVNRQKQEKDR